MLDSRCARMVPALSKPLKMKNLLILLLLAGLYTPLMAQNGFGVKAGPNISSLSGKDAHRVGFHAGMYRRFAVTPNLYLQSEILYSQKGSKLHKDNLIDDVELDFSRRYDYVSTTLLLGYKAGNILSFQLGAEGSYLMNVQTKFNGESNSDNSDFADYDFSLAAGVQAQFNRFGVYARYVHGFTEMPGVYFTDVNGASFALIEDGKHRTFMLGASFLFSNQL